MSQDNIFREVDEELRSDRMRSLWRRFGPFVIGAAVAIVVLVAVNEGWSWYTSRQSSDSSAQLYAALDTAAAGDLATAQQQLDALEANGSGGYPVLAEFRRAALLAQSGDSAAAVAAYDALANDQSNPRLRALALVLAANILVDTGTVADVETRVSSIAAEGDPMRNAARELIGLSQYKAGDSAAAQASFEAVLNDPLVATQTRNRVSYYLAQMVSQGAITPAEQPSEADAAATAIDGIVSDDATAPAAATPAPAAADAPAPAAE